MNQIDEDIVFVENLDDFFIPYEEFETICNARYWTEDCDIDAYLATGWSWSLDDEFYRSDCESWTLGINRAFPTRYRLKDFALSKSLRRVLKKNRDLKTIIRPLIITPQKSALHEQHHSRYNDISFLSLQQKYPYPRRFPVKDMELCIFKNRRLVACSIFVETKKSVQSNSAFWDLNEPQRSLGILTVLLEMQYAIRKHKDFYYLGAYCKHDPNYQYKLRFPALEFYDWDNNCWVDKKDSEQIINQLLIRKEVLPPLSIKDLTYLLPAPTRILFPEIAAIALFGSHANGTARPDSDIDVLILTPNIQIHFEDDHYASCFGSFRYARREKWGSFETLRSFYREEHGQIEFNFALPDWANLPANDEARRIIKDGMKILYDPQGILEKLQNAVLGKTKNSL